MSPVRVVTLFALLASAAARASATLVVNNADPAGVGFNDQTPAEPVGGNPATTIGGQRLAVFQEAARIWGQVLDSDVTITILANFEALDCDATSGVLGRAYSPNLYSSGTSGIAFPEQNTWYVAAETERFAHRALLSGTGTDPNSYDIVANFNSSLGTSGCLGGVDWYYGFDGTHGQKINLLSVVLHEFGHGLGFSSFVNPTTGQNLNGQTDIWSRFLYDQGTGKHWVDLDDSGRKASVTSNALAWDGPTVKSLVPTSLEAALVFSVTEAPQTPSAVKDYLNLAVGQFGAPVGTTAITGPVRVASPVHACTSDGPLQPLTGALAIVDRGPQGAACTFVEKARNAQAAGAVAVLIANYTTGLLPPGGNAPDVTIPVLGITQEDGNTLKGAVAAGPVTGSLRRDQSKGYAGADSRGTGPDVRTTRGPGGFLTRALGHLRCSPSSDGAGHQSVPRLEPRPDRSPAPGRRLVPGRSLRQRHRPEHARLRRQRDLQLHRDQSGAVDRQRSDPLRRRDRGDLRLQQRGLHDCLPLHPGRSAPEDVEDHRLHVSGELRRPGIRRRHRRLGVELQSGQRQGQPGGQRIGRRRLQWL